MRFGIGQKRTAVAARSLSLVLVVITVGLGAIAAVYFSQGSSAAALNAQSSSSSRGSSSSVLSSRSSAVQPAAQASISRYPLVWAPNSPTLCDESEFCIVATLGFSGNATLVVPQTTTTIISSNVTTIAHGSTTTIIRNVTETVSCQPLGNATLAANQTSSVTSTSCTSSVTTYQDTAVGYKPDGSYPILVSAFVQDAATGQNVTTSSGNSVIALSCSIQPPAGYTDCYVMGHVPPGHTYKVTVSITKLDGVTLLAPSQTITVTE
jgi:hypothetical protein